MMRRCSRAVLDFLATTDVGRRVLAAAEDDAQSGASEWELRERREREEEERGGRRLRSWALRMRSDRSSFPYPPPSWPSVEEV
jgi:hypothetical protein